MPKKSKKRRLHYGRIFDLVLSVIFILVSIYTLFRAKLSNMLPTKYMLILFVILLLLNIIAFIFMLKRQPRIMSYVRRLVLVVICGAMLFVGNTLGAVQETLNQVTTNTSTTIKMSVIVPKSSNVTKLSELKNSIIGVQNTTDATSSKYMQTEMTKVLGPTFVYNEYADYSNMATEMVVLGKVDAMAISDSYLSMLNTNMENFKDSYRVIETYSREEEASEIASAKNIDKEAFTVYITGMDELGSPDQNLRSDVNILLMINPTTNHIQMVSFPRDSYMPNMALNGLNDKLTHTGNYGADATVKTVENFLGIDIDFYAKVSFSSLIEIVDLIGGIEVDVELNFCEQDESRMGSNQVCLDAGVQTLDGRHALGYSRHRHTEGYGTAGRERAQQRIISGIIKKIISPEGLANINGLIKAVPNYVLTNMPSKQITNFISSQISDIKPWTLSSTSIGSDGVNDTRITSYSPDYPQDVYLYDPSEIERVLYSYQQNMQSFNMSNISFDMSNLYKNSLSINTSKNIVWSTQAISPH